MNIPTGQRSEPTDVPWLVGGDYGDALIHIAWLVTDGKRYLVFGLVEMFPSELPAPDEAPEDTSQYREHGTTYRIFVKRHRMAAGAALSWYGDCRAGRVLLPGDAHRDGSPKVVEASELVAEPTWPNIVAANELPFVSSTWGTVRAHHLLPRDPLPAVADLMRKGDSLQWLSDRLFFDLSKYGECVGSLHLVAPNPVYRELIRRRGVSPNGDETTVLHIVTRAGQTLDGLQLYLTTYGPTGITHAPIIRVAEPMVRVPHQGDVESMDYRVICPKRGVLDWAEPGRFVTIDLNISMIGSTLAVQVPCSPGRRAETYPVPVIASTTTHRIGMLPPATPIGRVGLAQEVRRSHQASAGRVERWFQGGSDEAAQFVRDLIHAARFRVWIVDPYFAAIEFRRFGLSVASSDVRVRIVTGARHLKGPGKVLEDEIARLRQHVDAEALVMTGDTPVVHDRFLVIDDTVWLSGNSLHTLGKRAGMIVKLARPAEVIARLQDIIGGERVTTLEKWNRDRHGPAPRGPSDS